jgi:hypothetical protein
MRAIAAACCILMLTLTAGSSQAARPPRFQDYPVQNIYRGKVEAPKFGDLSKYEGTDVRCYGGEPSTYAAEPVNFAGHFVISACPCGTGCQYLFMWDALSGKVYLHFPFGPIDVGPYSDGSNFPLLVHKGEEYRTDSSLLVVEGCIEDTCDCARRYYNWNGRRFNLLLRQATPIPPKCKK